MNGRPDAAVLRVLLRPSVAILLIMLVVIGWAGYLVLTAPDDLRAAYIVMLLCQSFAASSGYASRARRGHFDQLLAGRTSRLRFGLMHGLSSVVYGAAAWVVISGLDALGAGGHWPLGLTPRAAAAFVYVSAVSWGLSVPFSRYAIGLMWLIVTVGIAASGRLLALRNSYANLADAWAGIWPSAGSALVFPPFMVGEPTSPRLTVLSLVFLAAVAAAGVGVTFICSYCLALEDVE